MAVDNEDLKILKDNIAKIMDMEESYNDSFFTLVANNMLTIDQLRLWQQTNPEIKSTNEVIMLPKGELVNNPYLKDIEIKTCYCGNIMFSNNRLIEPRKLQLYDEPYRNLETFELAHKYYYCDDFIYLPAISEKEYSHAWMTIEPLEINTFKNFIESAYGDVLLLGCGLGYVAYMLSLKPEVKSITIVDIDAKVLSIFNKVILPQFKNRDKVKVIHADGIEYLKNTDLNQYDCINIDVWRDIFDMISFYLPCLEIEQKYPNVEFSYWIEDSLKEFIQTNILRYFVGMPNDWPLFASIAKSIVDNSNIESEEDLRNVIELSDMREILYNWYINNLKSFKDLDEKNKALNKKILESI